MGNNNSRAYGYPPDPYRHDPSHSRSRSYSRRPHNDWYGGYPGEMGYRSNSQPYRSYSNQTAYVQPSVYQPQQMVQAVQPQVFRASNS